MSIRSILEAVHANVDSRELADVSAFVAGVERRMTSEAGSTVATVERVGRETLNAGGKRLRPALMYVSALATGSPFDHERAVALGAALEFVHMATLIHDDVVDGADVRRGKPTAAALVGATAAVLSGDVLLSKALRILAWDGDIEILKIASETVVQMAEGEVRELEIRGNFDLAEEEHMRILTMKTAVFIACCCRVGAFMTGADERIKASLEEYGRLIGLAFQVIDDLLDFRGDGAKTGKPKALDFREGCATLPLIYLRPLLKDEEEVFLRRKFGNGVTDDEVEMLSSWMESRGAYDRAFRCAQDMVTDAKRSLAAVPPGPYRDMLERIADYIVRRES